ncbi:hypothetical protein FOZ61_008066 [Perkinsus olseni]|uniref:Uncharacterized protein n=1 Tax=Perkinsus olseni TaxID=32597 RepID=A0A7J6LEN4_PEROL|nr:hypothetical protein FOZ61_008066 [Perkinsus olseni]KAF4657704.1 hypothetical protein FOL46_007300 [Perkinsus olseni]
MGIVACTCVQIVLRPRSVHFPDLMTRVVNLLLLLFCLLVAIEYCNAGWIFTKHDEEPPDEEQPPHEEQPFEEQPVEEQPPKVDFYLDPADPGDGAKELPNGVPEGAVLPGIDASVPK